MVRAVLEVDEELQPTKVTKSFHVEGFILRVYVRGVAWLSCGWWRCGDRMGGVDRRGATIVQVGMGLRPINRPHTYNPQVIRGLRPESAARGALLVSRHAGRGLADAKGV